MNPEENMAKALCLSLRGRRETWNHTYKIGVQRNISSRVCLAGQSIVSASSDRSLSLR
jgi:hypothetical protein